MSNKTTTSDKLKMYLKHPGSFIMMILVMLAAILTFTVLLFLIAYILMNGVPHLKPSLFAWEYSSDNASVMPALVNTVVMTLLSLLIAVPFGIFSAIFLVEYAGRGNKFVEVIRLTTETLSGIPSIVYGLFGMLFFCTAFGGYSILAGTLTMAIMVLPLIMRTTEEALIAVPDMYREASFGLGAGKLRTIFRIILPAAVPAKGRLPLLIICAIYCIFFAVKTTPDEPVVQTKETSGKSLNQAPLSPFAERAGYLIFILDALGLMFAKQIGLDNWQITVIGALLMIICGVLKPKEAVSALPVSMLLLIVGALAMSGALSSTGAGEWIGGYMAQLVTAVNGNSYIVGAVFFVIPFIMTQFMQNRATMMIFHPIAIATCASIGGNPIGLMILIQAGCLSAFMTPMATAAIPYMMDYGGYNQSIMFKMSWLPAIIFILVSVLWTMTIFPIL